MPCPVRKTCYIHRAADQWTRTGQVSKLTGQMDLWGTLSERAWAACTCGLYARILALVGEPADVV